ncbi:hypothetical protein AUJ67_01295 [Candidatus Desantisbacteria bacterium CG1_02_49_89]|nr:MAG: hypothetical protein AUJ67_01295 [Candidatus Desantisbacteria bacterium CG1_02_49_89]
MEGMNGMGGEPANIEPMPETEKEWVRQSMAFADILGMLDAFKEPAGDMKDAAMPEDGYAAEEDSFWVSDFMDEMGSEKALKMESMKTKETKEMKSDEEMIMEKEEDLMEPEDMGVMGDGMM